MRRTRVAAAIGLLLFTLPAAARAQEQSISQKDLDAMVTAHAEELDADRAVVETFLARPEVARIAAEAGIDVLRAESAVAVLGEQDLRQLAVRLDRLDGALASGDAITIETTTIIIGLLVLIVLLAI
jgi:ABC-type Fe3+ transport system permease subunit